MAITVNAKREQIFLEENEKVNHSLFQRFIDYTSNTSGVSSLLSLIKNVSRLSNALSESSLSVATRLDSAATVSSSAIGIVRLPNVTKKAFDSLSSIQKDDGVSVERKTAEAFSATYQAFGAWWGAAQFLGLENPVLKKATTLLDLGADSTDLCLSVSDYKTAVSCESLAKGDVKDVYTHAKKYQMLRIAKAVFSVASAILAVIGLVAGVQLPLIAGLILAIVTTLLAIRRDSYKDEGRFKLLDVSRHFSVV